MFYVGIDIAKKAHEVCFLNENSDVLDGNSFKIPNTLSGIEKLSGMLNKYGLTPENTLIGLESTGHYWLVLYSWLTENNFIVKVINPIVTDAYRHMLVRKVKNDRIDAQVVAQVLMIGEYQETTLANEDILSLRQLCRFRLWQVQTCADLKKKIITLLDQTFPEYENLFSNVFGLTSKEVLKNYTSPEELASISTSELTLLLKKFSKGHFGEEKALEIKAVAKKSIGIDIGREAFTFQIRQILDQITFVEEQIESLDKQIESYMLKLDSPITSIPGIGNVYGAVILSEIGDISRFHSAKQLVAYAGIDASVHESGSFQSNQAHMSKRGSPYLRKAIYGAAFVSSWSDPELSDYYKRLKNRGKHHNVAVGAIARKLCHIIFAILTENRNFEKR